MLPLRCNVHLAGCGFHKRPANAAPLGIPGEGWPKELGKTRPRVFQLFDGSHAIAYQHYRGEKVRLACLIFDYKAVSLNIINNGHTIQVNYAPGSSLTVGGKTYTLQQFHFHHPSEEHVNGHGFDMVAHLVHSDGERHFAVVAVLLQRGNASAFIDVVWKNIPNEQEKTVDVPSVKLTVKDLLPANHGYYTFAGSLTTPPCSEGVTWFVLKTPASLSASQLAEFAKLYPTDSRPIRDFGNPMSQRRNRTAFRADTVFGGDSSIWLDIAATSARPGKTRRQW